MHAHTAVSAARTLVPLALFSGALFTVGCAPPAVTPRAPDVAGVHAERITLTHGQVKEVATMLRALYPADAERGDGARVVTVLANPAKDEIIVFGNDAGVAAVRATVSPGCVDATADARAPEVVFLTQADAHVVESAVRPFARSGRVVVDGATNALVIDAPSAAEMQRLKQLVAALDVAPQGTPRVR
ncbi:MAG TPA: secretin N-terminal domain-containing protein [Byssovorax sp.]|jgi:type II secretory pathway component GspD/PulD (secretin)